VRQERIRRRLAAILVADVAGYSRLMGADEAGTLRRLKAIRRELIDPSVREHGGRIVKTSGDGILIEFPSAVEAVSHAVQVQHAMARRNADVPPERRIEFRVGINLGDVIADKEDIHGDGVNVAARLQTISEPSGLAVSGSVHDQVRNRLALAFEDRGEREVKNIARPVRVFALSPATIAALPDAPKAEPPRARTLRHPLGLPLPLGALVAAVLIAAIGVGAWVLWPTLRDVPASGPAVTAAPATPATAIASPRLSIVVLPFANLSGDPEQDYFADGLVEDLTTDLSRIPGAFVIARNTAFTYKGEPVDVREVGRDLGVRYALEGSVRRIGGPSAGERAVGGH
jgi:class 3 adenylate cyclase